VSWETSILPDALKDDTRAVRTEALNGGGGAEAIEETDLKNLMGTIDAMNDK